jgi:integrative and conjugative element protein (TIGR02256 family)
MFCHQPLRHSTTWVGSFTAEVLISEMALDALEAAARSAHPLETGGVLLGVTAEGIPWITAVTEIEGKSTRRTYEMPSGTVQAAVDEARLNDSRLGYLGEWHSHPGASAPSQLDRASIAAVAYTPEADSPSPLLSIAERLSDSQYRIQVWRWTPAGLVELRITRTGGLAPCPRPAD